MKTNNKIINEIGSGSFGTMYSGLKDEEAIAFLLEKRGGEVIGAISRIGFSDIDLVYGVEGGNGYGLAHIEEQHSGFSILIPEIIKNEWLLFVSIGMESKNIGWLLVSEISKTIKPTLLVWVVNEFQPF